jgi:hypothetical protein
VLENVAVFQSNMSAADRFPLAIKPQGTGVGKYNANAWARLPTGFAAIHVFDITAP